MIGPPAWVLDRHKRTNMLWNVTELYLKFEGKRPLGKARLKREGNVRMLIGLRSSSRFL